MNINNLAPNINGKNLLSSTQEVIRRDSSTPTIGETDTPMISPLAQLVYTHELTDLTFNSNQTSYAYYKQDNSLAMQASSEVNTHLQEEKISLSLTFSAESLGLGAKDFEANGGKPITLEYFMSQTVTQVHYTSKTSLVQTQRTPTQVLTDLAKGLSDTLRDRGNKSVSYVLDEEAMKSILSDSKMTKLLSELVLLMATINMMKRTGSHRDYVIYVSGKGKPYMDHQEKLDIQSKQVIVNYKVTINPPQAVKAALPATAGLVNVAQTG